MDAQAKVESFSHLLKAECRVKGLSFGEASGDEVREWELEGESRACGDTALESTRPKAVEAA